MVARPTNYTSVVANGLVSNQNSSSAVPKAQQQQPQRQSSYRRSSSSSSTMLTSSKNRKGLTAKPVAPQQQQQQRKVAASTTKTKPKQKQAAPPQRVLRRSNSMPVVASKTAATKIAGDRLNSSLRGERRPSSLASVPEQPRKTSARKSCLKKKSGGKVVRHKTVRFEPEATARLSQKDLSTHERSQVWYNGTELTRMKQVVLSAHASATHPSKLSRGLEPLDKATISIARTVVFRLQRQSRGGDNSATPTAISKLYRSKSLGSVKKSLERARKDAAEAKAYQTDDGTKTTTTTTPRRQFSFRRK